MALKIKLRVLCELGVRSIQGFAITSNDKVRGQPGTQDIAKQMFYQMAFYRLIDRKDIVNAFLLPKLGIQKENGRQEDDDKDAAYSNGIDFTETITIGSREKVSAEIKETEAFKDIKLFTVRIPGISLLRRYANYEVANDWFKAIAEFVPNKGKA